jgi:hypothetical protein
MAPSNKSDWIVGSAVALILGGLGIMTGLATQAPENPWCTWWWVALLALSAASVLLGVLLFTNYAINWPRVELSHAVREAQREARLIEEIQAYWNRHHMIDELRTELEMGAREWQHALEPGKQWVGVPPNNAWSRHSHSLHLISPEAERAVKAAYEARDEILAASQLRAEDGSETWALFTDSEAQERSRALALYQDAIAELDAAKRPPR